MAHQDWNRVFLALVVVTALSVAGTTSGQNLIAECAKIEDQARRVECFDAVAKNANRAPSSDEKFAALMRAGQAMVGAIRGGLNYNQLSDRIVGFSADINVARSQATASNEKAAIAKYDEALSAYSDSRQLWDADIRYNSRNTIRMSVPVFLVSDIVARHDLPTVAGDLFGITRGVDAERCIRMLWDEAESLIGVGEELLRSPELVAKREAAKNIPTAQRPNWNFLGVTFTLIETALRAEPTETSPLLLDVARGITVDVIEIGDGWTRVRLPLTGQEGWVLSNSINPLGKRQ